MHSKRKSNYTFATTLITLFAAVLMGCVLILLNGDSPAEAYGAMLKGTVSSPYTIANMLSTATPLILTGLGVSIAMRAGISNIGAEGQLYMGAIAAAVTGIFVKGLPLPLHAALCLLAAFAAGGLFGMGAMAITNKTGADIVVITIMGNYIAQLFTGYLASYPLKLEGSPLSRTQDILGSAKLPLLYTTSRLNMGFIVALVLVALCYLYVRYTVGGYEMTLVGQNRRFARYIGVNAERRALGYMFASGGVSGVAGAVLVCGVQYYFMEGISKGYGFDGLTIALLSNSNPLAVIPLSILLAIFRSGSITMELSTSVPSELSNILQAILILFITARGFLSSALERMRDRRLILAELKKADRGV